MQKRGQITVFIIIGLIILASMLAFYYAGERTQEAKIEQQVVSQTEFDSSFNALESFVKDCTKRKAEEALLIVGSQGGFIYVAQSDFTPQLINYSDYRMPYLASRNISFVPPNEFIERFSLNTYLPWNIHECLTNFSQFPQFKVQDAMMVVSSRINTENVVFTISYPIVASQATVQKKLQDFSFEVPVRLGKIMEVVNHTVNTQIEFPGLNDVSYFSRQDLEFYTVPVNPFTTVHVIIDKKSSIFNQDYYFMYATHI